MRGGCYASEFWRRFPVLPGGSEIPEDYGRKAVAAAAGGQSEARQDVIPAQQHKVGDTAVQVRRDLSEHHRREAFCERRRTKRG